MSAALPPATPIFSNRAYALSYAKLGWPVFPLHSALGDGACTCGQQCGNPGKHPRIRTGLKGASTDAEQITRWWADTPDAPIGIVCGDAHDLLVIDIDPRNGGDVTWATLCGEHGIVQTIRVRTGGGGEHLYFKAPKTPIKSRGNALGPGVDISSNGHYVVAPPSVHASGQRYEFAQFAGPADMALADCPDWVIATATATAAKPRSKKSTAPSDTRGWLAVAFEAAAMLGEWQPAGGFWFARCPWQHEHSDGRGAGADSSTIVYPASEGRTLGFFRCEHAHCSGRSLTDVRRALPETAREIANKVYPGPPRPEPQKPIAPTLPAPPASDPDTGEVQSWRGLLTYTKGAIANTPLNASLILSHTPEWDGVLAYDEFAERIIYLRPPPWSVTDPTPLTTLTDDDGMRLSLWLADRIPLKLGHDTCWRLLQIRGKQVRTHPVRAYLEGLRWDGVARIDMWLTSYLGVPVSAYSMAIGAKWLVSAVARIYEPGCQADHMLILEGPQGAKKSTALRTLAGAWFTDELPDLHSKDASLQLLGRWIVEVSELDAMTRADVSAVKAYTTRRYDIFRAPYGRVTQECPRQCVFAGTTNSDAYLRDETGARRFWPVRVGTIDIAALAAVRDQLWAETLARYRSGERWHIDSPEILAAASDEQESRYQPDAWEEEIRSYCDRNARRGVSVGEVLKNVFAIEPDRWIQADQNRVARAFVRIGLVRRRTTKDGQRIWLYYPNVALLGAL